MNPVGPPVHFLNIAYFFQLLYNLVFFFKSGQLSGSNLVNLASNIWLFVTLLAYLFSIACIGFLVYYSTRLYQIADEEKAKYTTITKDAADEHLEHSRWSYIRRLIESPQESDWRSAIIEADIMLDELLSKLGYVGDGVGEKLKTASSAHFHTLQDAWDAHRVRNDIAHQGSSYELSPNVAYRTIGHYENVFREFDAI
ncbi:MAG: hypothetical protein P4M11_05740 [Candidatus Pacebacteria bacterium]|nr:hypothetical protein [Candidatus Paceibacterota bacterium]